MLEVTEPSKNVWKIDKVLLLKSYVNKYTSKEKIQIFSVKIVRNRRFLKTKSTRAPETSTPMMLPHASQVSFNLMPV